MGVSKQTAQVEFETATCELCGRSAVVGPWIRNGETMDGAWEASRDPREPDADPKTGRFGWRAFRRVIAFTKNPQIAGNYLRREVVACAECIQDYEPIVIIKAREEVPA